MLEASNRTMGCTSEMPNAIKQFKAERNKNTPA